MKNAWPNDLLQEIICPNTSHVVLNIFLQISASALIKRDYCIDIHDICAYPNWLILSFITTLVLCVDHHCSVWIQYPKDTRTSIEGSVKFFKELFRVYWLPLESINHIVKLVECLEWYLWDLIKWSMMKLQVPCEWMLYKPVKICKAANQKHW